MLFNSRVFRGRIIFKGCIGRWRRFRIGFCYRGGGNFEEEEEV